MTDFLREWAKHYPIRFIIALILCVFFVRSMTSDLPWGIIIILLVLSAIIQDRLREFNSSFEGLLVDKYDEPGVKGGITCYFKFSKGGREFIRQVDLEQYEVAEIGDYVKKEPKTFGLQITPTSDSTDNT